MQDSNKNLLSIYDLREYVAIDLETTGLNPSSDKIIEISAVKFTEGGHQEIFSYLLDPGKRIPPFIEDLTGISNQMVKGKPKFSDIMNEFSNFIGDIPVVGHNVKFDIDFIKFHSNESIDFSKNKICDTYLLSKIVLFPNSEFNLESITEHYKFPIGGSHRATQDSINSGKIFIKLLEDLSKMDISIIDRINKLFSKRFIPNNHIINSAYKYIKHNNNLSSNLKINLKPPIANYHKTSDLKSLNFEDILGSEGVLYQNNKYQFRESQYNMTKHISKTIDKKEVSIIEAGTGLGKTYAYLIPFIYNCKKEGKPLVISTYTKTLQEQLFNKDLKDIVELMNIDLKIGILKGRYNYICPDRLKRLESNADELISDFECHDLASLIAWSYYSKSGDIEECGSFSLNRHVRLWNLIKSDAQFCAKHCNTTDSCHYSYLSSQLKDMDVIVVNHALLIIDAVDNRNFIPKEHFFVIDEAHDLFKAAKDILMTSYDKSFFNDPLSDISTFINMMNNKSPETDKMIDMIDFAKDNIESFFSSFLDLKSLNLGENNSYPSLNTFKDIKIEFQDCSPTLIELVEILNELIKNMSLLNENFIDNSDFIDITNQFMDRIELFMCHIKSEDYLSWMKFHHPSKSCSINYLMKDIGKVLFQNYFQNENVGVLCSATLSVNNDFDFFKSQIGLDRLFYDRDITEAFFSSPFFLEDQLKFYGFKSDLNINSSDYIENIAEQILGISNFYNKRMLILCTSYKQASELKNRLYTKFLKKDTNLYVHERGRSKNSMLRAFKNNPGSVLIGTMAFWEGIDLPGDELSILMMLRIPFSNPNDPYLKYINNQFSINGKNGFNDYQVPEACLKMKQGFGRLIRTEYDSGLFIITDPRFYNSSYSHKIKNSFPIDSKPYTHFSSLLDN